MKCFWLSNPEYCAKIRSKKERRRIGYLEKIGWREEENWFVRRTFCSKKDLEWKKKRRAWNNLHDLNIFRSFERRRIHFYGKRGMDKSWTAKWGFKKCVQLWLTLSSPIGFFSFADFLFSPSLSHSPLFCFIIRSIIITLSCSFPSPIILPFPSLSQLIVCSTTRFKRYPELNWITWRTRWELCSWLTSRERKRSSGDDSVSWFTWIIRGVVITGRLTDWLLPLKSGPHPHNFVSYTFPDDSLDRIVVQWNEVKKKK